MLLMIDNYDSFTYNLVQYLGELGQEIAVYRNDQITIDEIEKLAPDYIVISPGPGTPDKAGLSMAVIDHFQARVPLLGVCLGHQGIGRVFGGDIVHANAIMHGKTSDIYHNNEGLFNGFEMPFTATRYHSLVVAKDSLPDCLEITAWTQTENGDMEEIMGMRHKQLPVSGVQFHPESILTSYGHELLQNFLDRQR